MELVLGKHNGIVIKGKNPRRPRMRKEEERLLLESTIRLTNLLNEAASSSNTEEQQQQQQQQRKQHILHLMKSDKWIIEENQNHEYTILLHDPHYLFHFINSLSRLVNTRNQNFPSTINTFNHQGIKKSRLLQVLLPYINFHGELYASPLKKKTISNDEITNDQEQTQLCFLFQTALPALLDDCIYYLLCCMNHYYPILPKKVMIKWYSQVQEPLKDPLVLALGLFWARHVFIHHFPTSLFNQMEFNNALVELIQTKLAEMVREALSDCFDVPHIHLVYALSLCNMTNNIATEQKALWHTVAVRMAMALMIRPREINGNEEDQVKAELENRTWWYLFHVDHFLLESGTISNSLLLPASDDHDALLSLLRPTPCPSIDGPDEIIGALVWNNVLKLWLIRRKLVKEIEQELEGDTENDDQKYINLMDKVFRVLNKWQQELPQELQLTPIYEQQTLRDIQKMDNNNLFHLEACYVISMERCTNVNLLMRLFFPQQYSSSTPLTDWQRKAIMTVVECSIEFVRIRGTLVQFAPCQTWPGDLKRTIELLITCMQYNDPEATVRSQLCLMRALRVLRCYNELKWHDDTCMKMIRQIEDALDINCYEADEALTRYTDNNIPILDDYSNVYNQHSHVTALDDLVLNDQISQPYSTSPTSTLSSLSTVNISHHHTTSTNATTTTTTTTINNNSNNNNNICKYNSHNHNNNSSNQGVDSHHHLNHSNKYTSNKRNSPMKGMMLFDRKLQPRNQYYQPPPSMDPSDQLSRVLVFEDTSKFKT